MAQEEVTPNNHHAFAVQIQMHGLEQQNLTELDESIDEAPGAYIDLKELFSLLKGSNKSSDTATHLGEQV